MELKRSARLTAIPQLGVPEIYVDNDQNSDNEQQSKDKNNGRNSARASGSAPASGSTNPFDASSPTNPFGSGATALSPGGAAASFLSADDARAHHRSWSGVSADLSSFDTSYGHPLAGPRANKPSNSHRNTHAYSFELHDSLGIGGGNAPSPGGWAGGPGTMGSSMGGGGLSPGGSHLDDNSGGISPGGTSKRGTSVSPGQLSAMLDDSVWVASIRRSATMRRGQNNNDWGGGGGGGGGGSSGRSSGGGYSGAY